MPKNLTPISQYTGNLTVPVGGDPRTAASVEPAFQTLGDRALHAKNRLDVLEMCAVYQLTGLGVTAKPTLTELFNKGGFVLASNEVVVPVVGTYIAQLCATITSSDTSNPRTLGFVIKQNATTIGEARTSRFSADINDLVGVSGNAVAIIADVADHIYVNKSSDTGNLTLGGNSRLIIRRVA